MKNNIKTALNDEIVSSSISKAITTLIDSAMADALSSYEEATDINVEKVATTLRLPPNVSAFYRSLASTLNISLQETICMTLNSSILLQLNERDKTRNV